MSWTPLILLAVQGLQGLLFLWYLRRLQRLHLEALRLLKDSSRELIDDYRTTTDYLRDRLDSYESMYAHFRQCRHMLDAGTDETLADAISRHTGISSDE